MNDGEYKLMGLAAYGRPRYVDKLIGPILRLSEDGAFALNQRFFDFCSTRRHYAPSLAAHLGIPPAHQAANCAKSIATWQHRCSKPSKSP